MRNIFFLFAFIFVLTLKGSQISNPGAAGGGGDVSGPGVAVTDNAITTWDGTGGVTIQQQSEFIIDDNGLVTHAGGTLSSSSDEWWDFDGTFASSSTASSIGMSWNFTSVGTGTSSNVGWNASLLAGYTGSRKTALIDFNNFAAGTGASLNDGQANFGIRTSAIGDTTGMNVGISGFARNGTLESIGVVGFARTDKANADYIGVMGAALNNGAGATHVGGYFVLDSPITFPIVSAALISNNHTRADKIYIAQDNNVEVYSIADFGLIDHTPGAFLTGDHWYSLTATMPTGFNATGATYAITGAGTDNNIAVGINLLDGATGTSALQAGLFVFGNTSIDGQTLNWGTPDGAYGVFSSMQGTEDQVAGVFEVGQGESQIALIAKNFSGDDVVGDKDVGIAALLDTGGQSPANAKFIAGWFKLSNNPSDVRQEGNIPTINSVVVIENGDTTIDHLVIRDGGEEGFTTVFTVADGGDVTIKSALSLQKADQVVDSDDEAVTTANRSFILLDSDSVTSTDRTIVLDAGSDGQLLTICADSSAFASELQDTGIVKIAGLMSFTLDDCISLVSDGVDWRETSRSVN